MLSSYLGWYMQFGTIEKRPSFEAYVARHTGRAAHAKANALDDAAMPAKA